MAEKHSGQTFVGPIDFSGTDHAGLRVNNLTTTQRDLLTPANGMIIYNTTSNLFEKYQNGSWVEISSTAVYQSQIYFTVGSVEADYVTDGTADDVQIQAAIDAANTAGGGTVYIKEGIYNCAAGITLKSNVNIIGDGISTQLKLNDGVNVSFFGGTTISDIVIQDIYINGNGVNQTSDTHTVRLDQATNVRFLRCQISNAPHHVVNILSTTGTSSHVVLTDCIVFGDGLRAATDGGGIIVNGTNCIVENCLVTTTDFTGIEIYSSATECIVRNNKIIWNGTTGCLGGISSLNGSTNCTVQGNVVTGAGVSGQAAIKLSGTNYTVIGNIVHDIVLGMGMWIAGLTDSTIQGNSFETISESHGIYIENVRNTFVGNIVNGALKGIYIRPAGHYNIVTGNVSYNNREQGIFIHGSATFVTVSNNQCINNGQAGAADGIYSEAGNCVISNNYCYDNQGTKTQRYGIRAQNTTVDYCIFTGNNCRANLTGGLSLSNVGANNELGNNIET